MAEPTAAAGAVNGAPAAPAAGVSAFSQRDAQHHLGSAAAPPNATVAQSFTEGAIPLHHLLAPLHAPHSPRNSPGHQGRPSRPRDDTAGLTHMPSIRHRRHELHISDQELLPTLIAKYHIKEAKAFSSAKDAVAYAKRVYDTGCEVIRAALQDFAAGQNVAERTELATYPFIGTHVGIHEMERARESLSYAAYGIVKEAAFYGMTLTRFDVLGSYYLDQLELLVQRYGVPLVVGRSPIPIPLPFVVDNKPHDISNRRQYELHESFAFPDLTKISDDLPNGVARSTMDLPHLKPLALFSAERTDLGLQRLAHYTGTSPALFQSFILLTNYQFFITEFITWGQAKVAAKEDGYVKLVGPHDTVLADGTSIRPANSIDSLPQMPAYHLVREDGLGITFVNIGVGPSNAKTITDHLAVLRPHCWIMIGHCAGLRMTQNLGDYCLAHAYVREDHVLDQDLPLWVPLPAIAEVQTALERAVQTVLGASGVQDVKSAMRTGTVLTTDNRDWELRAAELKERFKQSRAIAVDMESATIAANGFRFRVPYGTLLCVSDKPVHGELKLKGMANEFYRQRVHEHLRIGLEAVRLLRELGVNRLQSRKLRGFDEPPFR